jgi:hypothetical protein
MLVSPSHGLSDGAHRRLSRMPSSGSDDCSSQPCNKCWVPHCPDFLRRLVALIHSMRLSIMKGAHADLSSAAWQEIGVKPSFGLSGIRALDVPLRSGLLCGLMIRSERQAICKASTSAIKSVAEESLNMSQPGVSRAFNSVASLKAKGECYRSRIAAAIAGLRRLQSAAEIGRSAAHNLAKRASESRRRAIAYRQTDLGDVQHSVF